MTDAAHLQNSDEDVRLALAAARAIQRLVAERNALRSQTVAQARELTRLRRHATLIRDSYRKLTSEFIAQLQHMDSTLSAAIQDHPTPSHSPTHPNEDAPSDSTSLV